MPGPAGSESVTLPQRGEAAGLTDPAYFVPPIRSRSTRRFALAWLLTPLVLTVCLPFFTFAFVNRYDSAEAAFMDGLYQRKAVAMRRAADRSAASHQPRLVVVGGSGALLGIDAELLELKLGVPSVNLATHAGLGGEYLLDRARRELRPGDVVLLAPEYQLWDDPAGGRFTDQAWAYACTYDKPFLRGLGRERFFKLMYSVPLGDYRKAARGWRRRVRGRHWHTRPSYNLATVSPNGDLRATLSKVPFAPNIGYPFPDVGTARSVPHFRRFAEWARVNGVRVFFTWPNAARPDVPVAPGADEPPAAMTVLLNELGFVVLDRPSETVYPRAWFTDTAYHPDAACRRLRTEQLVRRLRPHLGLSAAPGQPTGFYLVAGASHRPARGNAFADEAGVRVKYLDAEAVGHPDAITPAGVAGLVGTGLPVYFDEPEAARLLAAHGWRAAEVARTTGSFPGWALGTYRRHILLIARPGGASTPVFPTLPRGFLRNAFDGTAPFVLATTPPLGVNHAFIGGAGGAAMRVDLRSLARPLAVRDVPQLVFDLAAPPAGGPAEVRVNRAVRATAWGPAVAVVVIDPELGAVADAATFPDATDAEVVTWRLEKLVPRD